MLGAMSERRTPAPETLVAQGTHHPDPVTGAVAPPVHASTTFARDDEYRLIAEANAYARDQNPGFAPAESMLARLEGAHQVLLFSSGMAAAMAVVQALRPGDRIVAPAVMYWGLRNYLILP